MRLEADPSDQDFGYLVDKRIARAVIPDFESTTRGNTMLLRNLAAGGALAVFVLTGTAVLSQGGGAGVGAQPTKDTSTYPIYRKFQDLKWERIIPEYSGGGGQALSG